MKRSLPRALSLACSVTAALLAVELAMRASSTWLYPQLRELHPTLGWALRSNVRRTHVNEAGEECLFSVNSWGQRGGPVARERSDAGYRVLFLGDSFTEGHAVDSSQVFSQLLADGQPGLEALNAGVACYGTVQELLYLRDEGLDFHPDLVVVMFFANDLRDNTSPWFLGMGARPYAEFGPHAEIEPGAELESGSVRIREDWSREDYVPFCLPVPYAGFLYQRSYLYRSLNSRFWQVDRAERLAILDAENRPRFDPAGRLRILLALFESMQTMTDEVGTELAVALIPTREHVRSNAATPYESVLAGCSALDIPTLSLHAPLRAAHLAGAQPYNDRDIHWTPAGHAVVARALDTWLLAFQKREPQPPAAEH